MSHRQNSICMNYYISNNAINVINMYISTCPMLQDIWPRVKSNTKSQNIRLRGTSGIINFSQQKHGLDKTVQHPIQPNLKSIQHGGIHHFPGKIISMADCFHYENFFSPPKTLSSSSSINSVLAVTTLYCVKVVLTPLTKLLSYELKIVNLWLGLVTMLREEEGLRKWASR